MAFWGLKSKKEEASKNIVKTVESINNLGKGSQFEFRIPRFDVIDPRLQDIGVPVAVGGTVTYSIEDIPTFLKMNKMEDFDDNTFRDKLKGGITKYVKSAVSNAPSDMQIPLVQIERKILEVSDFVQSRVIPHVENTYGVKVRALDITAIDIDKYSRGYIELKALTADLEKERIMAQHNAQLSNFNLQNKMQQDQLKMQNSLNLDAMQRQHEMQQMQMQMQLNNQSETMRIQREEMQRAARLQTETTFFEAHKANLNASTINRAIDNGYNPYEQNRLMGEGNMQQPMMGGMQPQVSYMLAVNGQQAGPFGWAQLQQLVQQGQLTQQTFVWTQGMTNWTPAGQVAELAPLFQCVAPPMPGIPQMM